MDLTLIVYLIVTWFSIVCGYYVILAIASFLPRRHAKKDGESKPVKLLVLVPAKNEEKVISGLVSDLETQDYPPELFRVLVIADHCVDRTAEVVRATSSGLAKVLIRESGLRGKGPALDYAIEHAHDELPGFEFSHVVVFDADNRIGSTVLSGIARALSAGPAAVQVKVLAKNPDTSSLARIQALESVALQRIWQVGKDRLGLVSALAGTGEAIRADVLAALRGFGNSLTDDLDLTIRMADRGMRVKYLRDVVTYDEKPDSLKTEIGRRVRWSAGHLGALLRYGPKLATKRPTRLRIDALFYLLAILTPLVLWISYFISILSLLGLATFSPTPTIVWVFLSGFWPSLVLIIPYVEGEMGLYRAVPGLFVFLLIWMIAVPIALAKLISKDRTWAKTPHGVSVDLNVAVSLPHTLTRSH